MISQPSMTHNFVNIWMIAVYTPSRGWGLRVIAMTLALTCLVSYPGITAGMQPPSLS